MKQKPNMPAGADTLAHALLALQTAEESRAFLEDLCTEAEIEEMSRRLYAARLLRGDASYLEVVEKTGLSTATISRVSRALKNGAGYAAVLSRLEEGWNG